MADKTDDTQEEQHLGDLAEDDSRDSLNPSDEPRFPDDEPGLAVGSSEERDPGPLSLGQQWEGDGDPEAGRGRGDDLEEEVRLPGRGRSSPAVKGALVVLAAALAVFIGYLFFSDSKNDHAPPAATPAPAREAAVEDVPLEPREDITWAPVEVGPVGAAGRPGQSWQTDQAGPAGTTSPGGTPDEDEQILFTQVHPDSTVPGGWSFAPPDGPPPGAAPTTPEVSDSNDAAAGGPPPEAAAPTDAGPAASDAPPPPVADAGPRPGGTPEDGLPLVSEVVSPGEETPSGLGADSPRAGGSGGVQIDVPALSADNSRSSEPSGSAVELDLGGPQATPAAPPASSSQASPTPAPAAPPAASSQASTPPAASSSQASSTPAPTATPAATSSSLASTAPAAAASSQAPSAPAAETSETAPTPAAPAGTTSAPAGSDELSALWVANLVSTPSQTEADAAWGRLRGATPDGRQLYRYDTEVNGTLQHRIRLGFYQTDDEARAEAGAVASGLGLPAPWTARPNLAEERQHNVQPLSDLWAVNISSTPDKAESDALWTALNGGPAREALAGVGASESGGSPGLYRSETTVQGGVQHRIRLGFFGSRAEAEAAGKSLAAAAGLPASRIGVPWAVRPSLGEERANTR
ncbi:MAG: SPOR domain-containing protein [Deltaproteobacteria bacterium]|jgi:hypothetical protein|nr:SPOR domain-containing protein [Deltaproteobacteria bacterium]